MSARVLQAAEVAVALLQRGHNFVNRRSALRRVARFPIEEKECLVFSVIELRDHNRSADVGAKLIAIQAWRGHALPRYGVVTLSKLVVAVKLPQRKMQMIGPALR